jgi:pyruvate formate lyase activating enzyme
MQKDLINVMRQIKKMGFEIKLDTNGTNPDILEQAFSESIVDYVAMDVKSSLKRYDEIAGVPVDREKLLKSIQLIKKRAPEYEFRTTVINGFHDEAEMERIGKLIENSKKYFIQKPHFDKTVKENFSRPPFRNEALENFCRIIKKHNVKICEIR